MRIVSEGRSVACVVPRTVFVALKDQAAAAGLTLAQHLADVIARGVCMHVASAQPAEREQLAARQWQEAAERANDDIAALRARLAEMEVAERDNRQLLAHWKDRAEGILPPAGEPRLVRGHRDLVDRGRDEAPASDQAPLTPAFVKSCVGFGSVGHGPAAIARLMHCNVEQVRRALKERR